MKKLLIVILSLTVLFIVVNAKENRVGNICNKEIKISVSSIDTDGAKIFYDSRDRQWYRFHNDEYQYYQDKADKPKSIQIYTSLIKQMKTAESYRVKANGQWINTKYKILDDK